MKAPQQINISTNQLFNYILHLADNALILGHRNSEWAGRGPILEQDIAISNIALDLVGQARNFYQYAANIMNESASSPTGGGREEAGEVSEDTLAYLRDSFDFKNCLLVEQPNGDWAKTVLRQFFFSTYQFYFYQQLQSSADRQLSAIAEKALKEVTYHLKWSAEWVIRLGDGTEESHLRIDKALDELWRYTGELTKPAEYEIELTKETIAVDLNSIKQSWYQKVNDVFTEATISSPTGESWEGAGKTGTHTEHLGYILAEMQFLQRAYPGCEW